MLPILYHKVRTVRICCYYIKFERNHATPDAVLPTTLASATAMVSIVFMSAGEN